MKKLFLFLIVLSVLDDAEGQNLVANPSFEDTIMCPLIGFGGGDCIFFNEGLGQTCSDWHSVAAAALIIGIPVLVLSLVQIRMVFNTREQVLLL